LSFEVTRHSPVGFKF